MLCHIPVDELLVNYNVSMYSVLMYDIQYIYIPKTKKFDCMGRGDLTFLFKSCEIDRSQGRLV